MIKIIFLCMVLVFSWFHKGLLFAGGEESLMFYDLHKSYTLFNSVWYNTDTGYHSSINLARAPYFGYMGIMSSFGVSNIQLQAFTFFILLLTGSSSIYFLLKETVAKDSELKRRYLIPFLGAVFYILNPFSMSQIWGRGLSFQFFSFALIPLFLLLFVLALKKKNVIYILIAILSSLLLSPAYAHPAIILTSWASIGIYFLVYILKNTRQHKEIYLPLLYFLSFFVLWIATHFFWIYPFFQDIRGLYEVSSITDGIGSLKGVSIHTSLPIVLRLVHNGVYYIDQVYSNIYLSFPFLILSWLIPFIALFSFRAFKKISDYKFYLILFLVSLFISIGSNLPTGWLLVWLFETFPLLQVLRNPYEKFGINLLIAYTPFFIIGLIVLSGKLSKLLKSTKLELPFITLVMLLTGIIFVYPLWNGSFAGGRVVNPWVKVPDYYRQADQWFNQQKGEFRLLHAPLIPGDGIRYNWDHSFQGIEPSEFLFSKSSISKSTYHNREYYMILIDRFGRTGEGTYSLFQSSENPDFKQELLYQELSKLNVKYIVLHNDIDWRFSGSSSPSQTKEYLGQQTGIHKVESFGLLDIYKVDVPANIDLIYSPDAKVNFQKVNSTNINVTIKESVKPLNLIFLEHFNTNWEAYIDGKKIERHQKALSYANSWVITQPGDYEVNIKYKPQSSFELGVKVTFISLLVLVLILFISILQRKIKAFH